MKKTINEAHELLEDMATKSYKWPMERLTSKKVSRVADVDVFLIRQHRCHYSTNIFRFNIRQLMPCRLIL